MPYCKLTIINCPYVTVTNVDHVVVFAVGEERTRQPGPSRRPGRRVQGAAAGGRAALWVEHGSLTRRAAAGGAAGSGSQSRWNTQTRRCVRGPIARGFFAR